MYGNIHGAGDDAFARRPCAHWCTFQGKLEPGSSLNSSTRAALSVCLGADALKSCLCTQLGKLKLHEEYTSVLVRVVDYSQAGILKRPVTGMPVDKLRMPRYARVLPPKHLANMRKEMKSKTYLQV